MALSELDVRCGKFLTNRRNVECTGEDYENISDIAKELAVANVRTFVGGWGRGVRGERAGITLPSRFVDIQLSENISGCSRRSSC